jgi:orotate phosphoribosyltransferase
VNANDILSALPLRAGHFLLESGYHSNLWVTLDSLFVDPERVAPLVTALAEKLRPYDVTAVCGPMVGGAFLALMMARELGKRFYFTNLRPASVPGLFEAEYVLPPELRRMVIGERVALVDDAISAGSSVRATKSALDQARASTVVGAALITFGETGKDYFKQQGIPVESLDHRELAMWQPDDCPLCRAGEPFVRPE